MELKETKIQSVSKFSGNIIDVYQDQVRLPNGKLASRDVVRHCQAVVVVPILSNGDIVFVEQYRYPLQEVLLELPAGKLDAGEELLTCAERELVEETGYRAEKMQYLGKIATTPGFCDEIIHVFLAEKLIAGLACPDSDEFLQVKILTSAAVKSAIQTGSLYDSKSLAALYLQEISCKKT